MTASGLTLYRLQTPAAIGQALHDIVQQKSVLSLYLPTGADDALVTAAEAVPFALASVMAVDVQAHTCTLTVASPLLPLPAQALGVAHMAGGVRVQCAVAGSWEQIGDKQWQLHMPWPTQILQLQRRRHPRIHMPLGHSYIASFMFGRRRCELDIDDLSGGGVALRGTRKETAMLFLGRELPRVHLTMADGSRLEVALKVRSRRSFQSFLLGEQVLVGCSVESITAEDRAMLDDLLNSGTQPLHA
jgi:flagellar brake protein